MQMTTYEPKMISSKISQNGLTIKEYHPPSSAHQLFEESKDEENIY